VSPRERILAAIDRKPVDRIPSDIWATPEIWLALKQHFGTDDQWVIRDKLGIDSIDGPGLAYTGKDRTARDGTQTGIWGTRYQEQPLPTGGVYSEQVFYPLKDATDVRALDDFNWENPADYDYVAAGAFCREACKRHAISAGYAAPFVDLWMLFGQEMALMNLALRPELIEATLQRTMAYRLEQQRLLFEVTKGCVDITQVTDDFGSQNGLVMSLGTVRSIFWPHYRNAIKLARSYGIRVFHHDDGAMSELIPDLIEMGVAVINPIQWRCPGMELGRLKRDFGQRIAFHGSIDNQYVIPFGTTEEIRAEVRKNLRLLGSDGTGFIIAPCHSIQSGTPLDNVLAIYDEIQRQGAG